MVHSEADEALLRAWDIPTDDQTVTEFLDEVESLLAILVPVGYVEVNEAAETWSFLRKALAAGKSCAARPRTLTLRAEQHPAQVP